MTRTERNRYAHWSNQALQTAWAQGFDDRVTTGPSKGCLRMVSLALIERVLTEAQRRGLPLQVPSEGRGV